MQTDSVLFSDSFDRYIEWVEEKQLEEIEAEANDPNNYEFV
jgi:hypothetical protein